MRRIGGVSSYLYSPRAPERIQHYIPDVKMIAILRNPVERAYLLFFYIWCDSREPLRDFSQALRKEGSSYVNWEYIWHYQQAGFYYAQLQRISKFNPEQIRVYLFEDFNLNPLEILQDIFSLLGETFVPDIFRSRTHQ